MGDVADVEEDVLPLAALGFVAGDGVGVFDLDGVEEGVCLDFLDFGGFGWGVGVVFKDLEE